MQVRRSDVRCEAEARRGVRRRCVRGGRDGTRAARHTSAGPAAVRGAAPRVRRRPRRGVIATGRPGDGAVTSGATLPGVTPEPPQLPGFRQLAPLRRGRSTAVYRARQQHPDRWVAITVFDVHLTERAAVEQFRAEARAIGKLAHPGILPVHGADVLPDARPYLVTELCEGSLADRIAARGRLDPHEVTAVGLVVGRALLHAHDAGVRHGDLTPEGVLLRDGAVPVLAGFELAVLCDYRDAGEPTPAHAAPETVRADGAVDERTDVYGLGSILFTALAGRRRSRPGGASRSRTGSRASCSTGRRPRPDRRGSRTWCGRCSPRTRRRGRRCTGWWNCSRRMGRGDEPGPRYSAGRTGIVPRSRRSGGGQAWGLGTRPGEPASFPGLVPPEGDRPGASVPAGGPASFPGIVPRRGDRPEACTRRCWSAWSPGLVPPEGDWPGASGLSRAGRRVPVPSGASRRRTTPCPPHRRHDARRRTMPVAVGAHRSLPRRRCSSRRRRRPVTADAGPDRRAPPAGCRAEPRRTRPAAPVVDDRVRGGCPAPGSGRGSGSPPAAGRPAVAPPARRGWPSPPPTPPRRGPGRRAPRRPRPTAPRRRTGPGVPAPLPLPLSIPAAGRRRSRTVMSVVASTPWSRSRSRTSSHAPTTAPRPPARRRRRTGAPA